MYTRRVAAALAASGALALLSAAPALAGDFVGPKGTLGSKAPSASNLGPGQFVDKVDDMHVDPTSGDLFAMDSWGSLTSGRVLRFSADGTFKSATPVYTASRMFEGPYDMAIQRSKTDAGIGRVLLATGGGVYAYAIDDMAAAPTRIHTGPITSIAVDHRDGSYYFITSQDPTDTSSPDVLEKHTAAGQLVRTYPRDLEAPRTFPSSGVNLGLIVDDANGQLYLQDNSHTIWKVDMEADSSVSNVWGGIAPPALPPLTYLQNETTPIRIFTENGVTKVWTSHSGFQYNQGANEKAVGIYQLGGLAPTPLLKLGPVSTTPGPCAFAKIESYRYGQSTTSIDGRTWYIDHGNGTVQIIGPGADEPTANCFEQTDAGKPTAKIKPVEGVIGTPVTLSGEPSTDDGVIARYEWDLDDDGAYDDATGKEVQRTFARGTHPVGLRVTDEFGTSNSVAATVAVLPPAPVAKLAVSPASVEVGTAVELDASASTGDALKYRFDTGTGFQSNATAKKSVTFTSAGVKTVRVEVTDGDDRAVVASAQVTVRDKPAPTPTPTGTPVTPAATPTPVPTAVPTVVPAAAGKVTIRSAKVSGAKLSVTLACAGGTCSGQLSGAGAKSSFSLAAGKTSTVTLKLSSSIRKKLAKGKVKIALTAASGGANVKKTFSLTTKKAKR